MLFIVVGNVGAQNVARIGTTEYATLQEALVAATSGQTVSLLQNVEVSTTLTVNDGVTLNGNLHTVTANKSTAFKLGDNTVLANLTIDQTEATAAWNGVSLAEDGNNVTFLSVKSNGSASKQKPNVAFLTFNYANLTLEDCDINNYMYWLYTNGTQSNIKCSNCKFSDASYGIFLGSTTDGVGGNTGIVSFENCEFSGAKVQIASYKEMSYKDCVIDGTCIALGLSAVASDAKATMNGCNLLNAANISYKYSYATAAGTYDISGNYWGGTAKPDVNGGATNSGYYPKEAVSNATTCTSSLTAENPNAGIKVAKIGDVKYSNLADAFAAAKVSETATTITLIATCTENVDAEMGAKNVILDLNGHVLAGNVSMFKDTQVTNQLQIKNGTVVGDITVKNCKLEITDNATVNGSVTLENCGDKSFIKGTIEQADATKAAITIIKSNESGYCTLNIPSTGVVNAAGVAVDVKSGKFTVSSNSSAGAKAVVNGAISVAEGASVAINGGTFNSDINSLLTGTDYKAVKNEAGVWDVVKRVYVAQIGTAKYEILAEAVSAVPTDGNATTIKMLANVDLAAAVTVALGQNIVLDLNGKTITSTKTAISNKGNLEVTGTGNITVTGTSNTAYGISNVGGAALTNRAHLVVGENVTITAPCSAVYTSYAYTTINGTLANTQAETSSNLYSTLRQSNSSEVIVSATAKVTGQVNAIYGNYGTVEVNSTNVVGKIYADGSATQGLKIKKTTAIESLNVVGHAEFSDVEDYYVAAKAFSACTGTVKLLSDINGALALSAGKTVTLDLNNHKVVAETYPIKVEGNLTITGEGTVQSTGMGSATAVQAATYVLKNGKLTILSGNYVAGFEGEEGNPAVYVRDNAVVEIKGGDFVGGSKYLLNKLDAYQETSVISVTGGTFHNNFNPADNAAEGEHTNFVAEGYESVDNGDGTWTVRQLPVYVEVHEEAVSVPETATEDEKTAANAAVEELGSNTAVTADEATNVAEVESVTTLKIEVTNVAIATSTIEGVAAATITKVVYDVQPMKDEAKVHETDQPITFRLPVPQSFNGNSVKVSHKHNEVITSTYETVQGEGANKFVALSSDKFSEWTLEDVNPSTVAVIGESQYNSLAEAVAAATNGQTITMLADAEANAMVEISGKNITLDLNGKTISPVAGTQISGGLIGIHNGAGLTIDDSSAEKNGTITSGSDGKVYAAVQVTVKGDAASAPATLVVNNGNLEGYYYAIAGNGARHNTDITIKGGTLKGLANSPATDDMGYAIFHPQDGKLTISGGMLEGPAAAVEMRAGTINVTGGTLVATATEFKEAWNASGSTITGAALAISQHSTNKNIDVNIDGGTFNGLKSLYEVDLNPATGDKSDNIAIDITEGTFNGSVASQNVTKFVAGGSFNEVIPQAYCAFGFVPETTAGAEGMYTVVESNTALEVYLGRSDMQTMTIREFVEAQKTQPNAMAVVSSQSADEVEGLTNVIVDYPAGKNGHYYECENFELDDNYDWFSPVEEFVAVDGSYSRGISGSLTTICVPFDVESTDFVKYIFHSSNEAGTTAYFNSVAKVNAGEAFIAYGNGSSWEYGFHNTRIYATPKEGGALRGTYHSTNVGTVYKVNTQGTGLQLYSGVVNYPFRAYFVLDNENIFSSNSSRSIRIAFDEIEDATTGISAVGNDADDNVIYNIQGLRQSKQQKGLNIVNGKKVLK